MKTLQSLASELYQALERRTRSNEDEFVALRAGSPDWMKDVIRAVHNQKLPDDTLYSFIERCAGALADMDESGDPQEAIDEMEPDIYTSDLIKWLAASNDHVNYITDALVEFGGDFRDGFQLLAVAQQIHIREVGASLIEELTEVLTQQNEDQEKP